MPSQNSLRYRGTNQIIQRLLNQNQDDEEPRKLLANEIGSHQSFLNEPRFNHPPKNVKISYAYEMQDSFYEIFKKFIPEFSFTAIKRVFDAITSFLKQSEDELKSFYDSATPEEKNYVETISSHIKEQYSAQETRPKLGVNTALYSMMLLACRMSAVAAQSPVASNTLSPLTFFNGMPAVNGADLCSNTQADFCNQFYVAQNDTVRIQGASYLSSYIVPPTDVKNVVGYCGDSKYLQSFLQNILNTQGENALGNESCTVQAYSRGQTIHLDNTLKEVSKAVCSALQQISASSITPCVQTGVANAFDQQTPTSSNTTSKSTTISPIVYFVPCFVGSFVGSFIIIRMNRARQAREATERQERAARARAQIAIAINNQTTASATPAIQHQEVELTAIEIVSSPHTIQQSTQPDTAKNNQEEEIRSELSLHR